MSPGDLAEALSTTEEVEISFRGRKSGKTYSTPVWFVAEGQKLYLLPIRGSRTAWYKNILVHPEMTLHAGGASRQAPATAITEQEQVADVVKKFEARYGAGEIKKWYTGLDAAVAIDLGR